MESQNNECVCNLQGFGSAIFGNLGDILGNYFLVRYLGPKRVTPPRQNNDALIRKMPPLKFVSPSVSFKRNETPLAFAMGSGQDFAKRKVTSENIQPAPKATRERKDLPSSVGGGSKSPSS